MPVRELSETERELVTLAINGDGGELRRLVELRIPELVGLPGRRLRTALRRGRPPGPRCRAGADPRPFELAEAVARQLFKLMAYKDEYEVARLHLDAVEQAKLHAEFGEDAKIWFNLHPPMLRSLGLERKLKLGSGSCRASGRSTGPGDCAARSSTRSATPRCAASSAR